MVSKQSYLKYCLICNSPVRMIVSSSYASVMCPKCGRTTEQCKNFYQACLRWNELQIKPLEDNKDEK